MTFFEVLLNVLAIIAIVAIGGAVIYFLGSFILSLLESKHKGTEKTVEKEIVHEVHHKVEPFVATPEIKEDKVSAEKLVLDGTEEVKPVDFESAQKEKNGIVEEGTFKLPEDEKPIVEENSFVMPEEKSQETKEEDFNNLFDDDKDFNFDDFDFDSFFEEQNKQQDKENENNQPVESNEVKKEEVSQIDEVETVIAESEKPTIQTETIEEPAVVENSTYPPATETESAENAVVAPVNVSNTEQIVEKVENSQIVSNTTNNTTVSETVKTIIVENKALEEMLRAEIAELRVELEEQKKLYAELKAQSFMKEEKWQQEKLELEKLYKDAESREVEKPKALLTLEEYQARLATLLERLRVNEKELKLNRKEFLPLRRVRKNLDKDKSKLRRREALVAKQKVLLYGVNNIMEIDQEKAKKLAEDLDLLDGLKVSVRHCEEVMEANKDRYPILETANRILTTTNEELKADIAECERAIREFKLANGDIDDGAVLEQMSTAQNSENPPKRKRGRPRKEKKEETVSEVIAKTEDKVIHTAETENVELTENTEIDETSLFTEEKNASAFLSSILEDVDTNIEEQPNIEEQSSQNLPIELEEEKPEDVAVVEVEKVIPEENNKSKVTVEKNDISIQKSSTTITKTNIEPEKEKKRKHIVNYNVDEPSYVDLFAIENEDWFDEE